VTAAWQQKEADIILFFEDDLIGAESWIGIIRKFWVDEEKI
jgi:hypothetical protein